MKQYFTKKTLVGSFFGLKGVLVKVGSGEGPSFIALNRLSSSAYDIFDRIASGLFNRTGPNSDFTWKEINLFYKLAQQ